MEELLLNLELMVFEEIQNCPFIKYPENLPSTTLTRFSNCCTQRNTNLYSKIEKFIDIFHEVVSRIKEIYGLKQLTRS